MKYGGVKERSSIVYVLKHIENDYETILLPKLWASVVNVVIKDTTIMSCIPGEPGNTEITSIARPRGIRGELTLDGTVAATDIQSEFTISQIKPKLAGFLQ